MNIPRILLCLGGLAVSACANYNLTLSAGYEGASVSVTVNPHDRPIPYMGKK